MDITKVRNFSIIAHIDHGKSTLADRMLEMTGTIEKRKMQAQVLDSMELEREKGITIKMTPARMNWNNHVLNLIDTPGHIDFSYEVSRALTAVDGCILLVDATQGVQAQTLTTLHMAKDLGRVIIPVITKIDVPHAKKDETSLELCELLDCDLDDIVAVSGKTGEGVEALFDEIIKRIPHPVVQKTKDSAQALVFDFAYSTHQGIVVYVRMFDGGIKKGDEIVFCGAKMRCTVGEVGYLKPGQTPSATLETGDIGYIVTGIKEASVAAVGDTITLVKKPLAMLPGYQNPKPVIWASMYPQDQNNYDDLRLALKRLKFSDASFTAEEETSGLLGRGYRCGFLGMLHLEIITERLRREYNLELIITAPSVPYIISMRNGEKITAHTSIHFPEHGDIVAIEEPYVAVDLIIPSDAMNKLVPVLHEFEAAVQTTELFGDNRMRIVSHMPLRELMRNFFDVFKSVTSGYGSLSYEHIGYRSADVVKLDVLVAEELVPAFSRIVSRGKVDREAEAIVEKLHGLLPQQLFVVKIQARALGRILASRSIKAMRKDVTGYLYGGDITRKKKLLEKQKEGKKKMQSNAKVDIPHEVFMKVVRQD